MTPMVSVVIPMRQTGRLVLDALGSLCVQSLGSWEAIVVDDGSTDEGPDLVEALAEEDRRVRLLRREPGGVSAARNTGLDDARGRWVVFLDADDVLEPNALRTLTETGEGAGTDGAFGAYTVSTASGEPLYTYVDDRDEVGLDDLFDRSYLWTAAHAVRRSALEGVRFDESLVGYEDRDVWLRLAERGVRWRCTPAPVSRYRIRRGSVSKDAGAMLRCAQRVVGACWSRQAGTPRSERRLDVGDETRLGRALRHLAVGYASRSAILDGPGPAAHAFAEAAGPKALEAPALARAGQYAVVYGLGTWPAPVGRDVPAWAAALHGWWRACEDAGYLPPAGADEAFALLGGGLTVGGRGRAEAA
jgi:hypothetical protein